MGAIKKAKPIDRGEDNHDDQDEEEGVVWPPDDEEQSSASAIETQAASVTHQSASVRETTHPRLTKAHSESNAQTKRQYDSNMSDFNLPDVDNSDDEETKSKTPFQSHIPIGKTNSKEGRFQKRTPNALNFLSDIVNKP
jgi:hypothetical protein